MAKGRPQDKGEPEYISTVMESVLANCEPIAEQYLCQLDFVDTSKSQFFANPSTLSSAINNLVVNSIEAGSTKVKIQGYETDSCLHIDIIDNGQGLDQTMQHKVLEPFFTTKPQGTGLGLAVVQSVVANHSGKLQLKCEKNKGCRASLHFPKIVGHGAAHPNQFYCSKDDGGADYVRR